MTFNSIEDIKEAFPTAESALKYLAEIRWGKWAKCVYCGNERCYIIENGDRYKCADKKCNKRFRVTVKTIMEDSNIPMDKWFIAIFMWVKSRGRVSHFDIKSTLGITERSEFFLSEKIKFIWGYMGDYIGKQNTEIFNYVLITACNQYDRYQDLIHAPYYKNPFHVNDIDDISDVKQYNILERYTSYYINVYCVWIWMDFASPTDILSEVFLYLKDNNIKEYNAQTMIRYIQRVVNIMWSKFLKEHPKYHEYSKNNNKRFKENQILKMSNSYIVDTIKKSKLGKGMTRKEIKDNSKLIEETREKIKTKRKTKGENYDFISHFS